jgi:hypothetical protein
VWARAAASGEAKWRPGQVAAGGGGPAVRPAGGQWQGGRSGGAVPGAGGAHMLRLLPQFTYVALCRTVSHCVAVHLPVQRLLLQLPLRLQGLGPRIGDGVCQLLLLHQLALARVLQGEGGQGGGKGLVSAVPGTLGRS